MICAAVWMILVILGVFAELKLTRMFLVDVKRDGTEAMNKQLRVRRGRQQAVLLAAVLCAAGSASLSAAEGDVPPDQADANPGNPPPAQNSPDQAAATNPVTPATAVLEAPARRALPSPWNSPPFPGSEYLGPTIGVPYSAPDYLLMRLLQGSPAGPALKESRIDIYGWINAGFNISTSKNSNLPNVYDIVPNVPELDQFVLRVERVPDTVQTDHLDWGFRCTNLYGTDYRFTVAKGWFDKALLDHNLLYGYDMPELYGLLYLPQVAEGMLLKVGRFISPPDIEAQLAPDNYIFTHSTMFSIDPYTFTGILAQVKLDNYWSIEAGIHAGADMAPWSDSASPNGHFMVRWVSNDNNDSIWAGVNSIGDGQSRDQHDDLQQVVGTWSHRFTEKIHMDTEVYYMWQYNALLGGTANNGPVRSFGGGGGPGPVIPGKSDSLGAVNYFQIAFTDMDYITIRTDFLDDYKGQRTGYVNTYTSNTIGWSHMFNPWLMVRPELKYERGWQNRAYDNGNHYGQFSFGVDVTVRF